MLSCLARRCVSSWLSFCFPKEHSGKPIPRCKPARQSISKLGLGWTMTSRRMLFSVTCTWSRCERKKWLSRQQTHHSHRKDSHTGKMRWSFLKARIISVLQKSGWGVNCFTLFLLRHWENTFIPAFAAKERKPTVYSEDSYQSQVFSKARVGAA